MRWATSVDCLECSSSAAAVIFTFVQSYMIYHILLELHLMLVTCFPLAAITSDRFCFCSKCGKLNNITRSSAVAEKPSEAALRGARGGSSPPVGEALPPVGEFWYVSSGLAR